MAWLFTCLKCGSVDCFVKLNGTAKGLYCKDCGAWQKWLGKDEFNAVMYYIDNVLHSPER